MPQPSPRSVLEALTRPRLAALGRELGAAVPASGVKETQVEALASSSALDLPGLLRLCADPAERKLAERGAVESEALRGLLRTQKSAIQKAIGRLPQLTLAFSPTEPKAREQIRQIEQDRHAMEGRLLDIDRESETRRREGPNDGKPAPSGAEACSLGREPQGAGSPQT